MKGLLTLSLLAVVGSAQAVIWGFAVPIMDGGQEVPPNGSHAYGAGSFTIDTSTWLVVGSMTLNDIQNQNSGVVAAHIHNAPVGVNGPVVFDIWNNQVPGSPLNTGPGDLAAVWSGVLPGTEAQRQAVLAVMIAGDSYINVHTNNFPGGEIRGQIECTGVVPEPTTMAFLGLGALGALACKRRKA